MRLVVVRTCITRGRSQDASIGRAQPTLSERRQRASACIRGSRSSCVVRATAGQGQAQAPENSPENPLQELFRLVGAVLRGLRNVIHEAVTAIKLGPKRRLGRRTIIKSVDSEDELRGEAAQGQTEQLRGRLARAEAKLREQEEELRSTKERNKELERRAERAERLSRNAFQAVESAARASTSQAEHLRGCEERADSILSGIKGAREALPRQN